MSGADPLTAWQQGRDPKTFSPAEAGALADHLTTAGYAIYADPKHPQHHTLSAEITALRQVAAPGFPGRFRRSLHARWGHTGSPAVEALKPTPHTALADAVMSNIRGTQDAQRLVHSMRQGMAAPDALLAGIETVQATGDAERVRGFVREVQKAVERSNGGHAA